MSGRKKTDTIEHGTPVGGAAACVIAVDDQPLFRAVVRDVVGATSELAVVGEADCGESAVELVTSLKPDMVVMDVRMPGIGGIEASRRIKKLLPATVVVLVSTAHPDALPPRQEALADELVWKNDLRPKVLVDIWRRHSGAPSPEPAAA